MKTIADISHICPKEMCANVTFRESCHGVDKRAKCVAQRHFQSCVCLCVCWLGGVEPLRQCEVEVRSRRRGCGVATRAPWITLGSRGPPDHDEL